MKYTSRHTIEYDILRKQVDDLITPTSTDYTEFDALCVKFRQLCKEVRDITGNKKFRGGYDQLEALCESDWWNNQEIKDLYAKIHGLNSYILHETAKLKLGSPEWWFKCWNITPDEIDTDVPDEE